MRADLAAMINQTMARNAAILSLADIIQQNNHTIQALAKEITTLENEAKKKPEEQADHGA